MERPLPAPSQSLPETSSGTPRGIFADAVRFWEPRRLVYNLLLFAVVMTWLVASWPHFRPALTLPNFLRLCVLALLANVCYCAAYLVDLPVQRSPLSIVWRHWRWTLWLLGTLFAILFENYWIADEIYPFVR